MNNAEKNYQIIRQVEEGRNFLLEMYARNPELLKTADERIRNLFLPVQAAANAKIVKQRGASLIELIMFIVIVSTALAGILLVMNTTTKSSADPLVRKQAMAAANSLLEEIELQDFLPASGVAHAAVTQGNRASAYHIVSDYNGFTTTGIFSLTDSTSASAVLPTYDARVTVGDAALGSIAAGSAVQIDVTLTHSTNGESITATGYRTAY